MFHSRRAMDEVPGTKPLPSMSARQSPARTGSPRPAYCGWRTQHRMFVRWATGERELYDYRRDPAEAHNLAYTRSWADVRERMRRQAVRHCTPEPPAFSW